MTTIFFPILTFSLVFILGLCIGIFIQQKIEKKVEKSIKDISKKYFTYTDQNGNIIKYPIQDSTIQFRNYPRTKIKLNKYEMDFLIKNIEKHLNTLGETYEENEYIQELYENLIKSKKHGSKSKTNQKHDGIRSKTKNQKKQKS